MIASLPMYARPELDAAFARFWDRIAAILRAGGINAPAALSQHDDLMALWRDPDLVLSQTCGMPYRKFLHGKVTLVGTPDYGLEGCPPGYYRSALVVRQTDARAALADFAQARFAYNEENSQSGFAAPQNHAQALGFAFSNRVQSHSHRASACMVSEGTADIAALDAVSWRHMQAYDAFAGSLRVLDWTAPPTPVLPFITARGNDPDLLFEAIARAIDALEAEDRAAIGLRGIVKIPASAYLAVPNPQVP